MMEKSSKTLIQLAQLQYYPSHHPWKGGIDPKTSVNYGIGACKRIEMIEEKLKGLYQYSSIDAEFRKITEEYNKSLETWKQVFAKLGESQAKAAISYSDPDNQVYQEGSEGKGQDHPHFKDQRNVNWSKSQSEFAKKQIVWIQAKIEELKKIQVIFAKLLEIKKMM